MYAIGLAPFAVSFSPLKGDFVGREALARQHAAYGRILARDFSDIDALPQRVQPVAVAGRGVARQGDRVVRAGGDEHARLGHQRHRGAVLGRRRRGSLLHAHRRARAALDRPRLPRQPRARGRRSRSRGPRPQRCAGLVVPYHLRSDAPPCARAIVWDHTPQLTELEGGESGEKALRLLAAAADNHVWRQRRCIDLIPSEMTTSPAVRLLSVLDPAFRYAEHKKTEAFYDIEVFYYQGTDFIHEVERLLADELRAFLGCPEVETRVISGQMANTAVFSALVDYHQPRRPQGRAAAHRAR